MGRVIVRNKRAFRDYEIEETYEAGMVLRGTEVKSLRAGRVSLKDGFAAVKNGEVFLYNVHIAPHPQGNRFNHDPERPRKLLLHRREINRLIGKTQEKGYTLVPIKIYFKDGHAKVELGVAKGLKRYDKREKLKREEERRRIERAMKEYRWGS
ncbi:MAG: SsrA-binding protein SmpB [Candidatus Bipolaricaulia bacterium]